MDNSLKYCTDIHENVKATAIVKWLEVGCNPFIDPVEREENANEEKEVIENKLKEIENNEQIYRNS